MDRMFPIRLDDKISSIPWAMIEPHEHQVWKNHQCNFETIAARGGFTPEEAIAILEDRPYERMGVTYATLRLIELVNQWRGVNVPALRVVADPPMKDRLTHAIGLVQRLRDGRAIAHKAHYNELEAILQAAREALQ